MGTLYIKTHIHIYASKLMNYKSWNCYHNLPYELYASSARSNFALSPSFHTVKLCAIDLAHINHHDI